MRINHLNNEHGDLEILVRRLVVVFVSIRSYNYKSVLGVAVWGAIHTSDLVQSDLNVNAQMRTEIDPISI